MIVLDSNVVSELMLPLPNSAVVDWLDRQPSTSVWTTSITVLECRFGIARMATGRRRDRLSKVFEQIVTEDLKGRVLVFDRADAERAADLSARRESMGRPIGVRDGMIAGIVLARRAVLATRNTKDFQEVGLDLVDPWSA